MYGNFRLRRVLAGSMAIVLLSTGFTITEYNTAKHTSAQDEKTKIMIEPETHSTFHDTDGDGWGEFEGFGTSLCWWANRVGYDETLTQQAATYFYDLENGLGMTVGRYNIGGGDDPTHQHITRSDSVVPGYAKDIIKISSEQDAKGYDQYDLTSGYAWNYDWTADQNQLNVLRAVMKEVGDDFVAEAFSNSPPYFMTKSGCSSGAEDGGSNLRSDCYEAFAKYLTDVTKHLVDEGISIQSLEGMNEPSSGWAAYSAKQEGCCIPQGEEQSKLIMALNTQKKLQGLDTVLLSGCDEMSTSAAVKGYQLLSDDAKSSLGRIDSHAYSAVNASDLRLLAKTEKKNLWMSEMDGATTKGTLAGQMSSALGLGVNISTQMNALLPSAWVLWDAIDIHADEGNAFDKNSLEEIAYSTLDEKGFWGLAVADHNQKRVMLTKKYYAYGQYSKFIRPGYTLLSTAGNNVAAYDKKNETLVVVIDNTNQSDTDYEMDLSHFGSISSDASLSVVRTSGTLEDGENWADVTAQEDAVLDITGKKLEASVKGNSITTYVVKNISLGLDKQMNKIEVPFSLPEGSIVTEALPNLYDGIFSSGYSRIKKKKELIIDLGQTYELSGLAFSAFAGALDGIQGGAFYGSVDGENWTKITDVDKLPTVNDYNYVFADEFTAGFLNCVRYIKAVDDGEYCALGELAVFGQPKAYEPTTPSPSANNIQSPMPTAQSGVSSVITPSETPLSTASQSTPVVCIDKKTTLSRVKGVKVKSTKKSRVLVKWGKVKNAKGYRVYYSTDKSMKKGKKVLVVKNGKNTKIVIKGLVRKKIYYFRVQAYAGKVQATLSKKQKVKIK